ncbi:MAG TPA: GNAT family N-acetyltransferase [Xanthobacteraceae bacterium]|nr:GNAT family N-acetyltransferase [Xanthobacteraceae bacterium]
MIAFLPRLFGPTDPVIAEASPADAAVFSRLHALSFRRGWSEPEMEQLLLDPTVVAHGARFGRRTIGFILSRRAADEAEILSVAIDPRHRGKGCGHALLELHLRRLAGLGVLKVFLEVDEANLPARRLYARAGFAPVGSRQSYYPQADGTRSAALVLRRNL